MKELTGFLLRSILVTVMTVGMMASMTEFRFGWRKLLAILALYSIWAVVSILVLLRLGGELLLLRLFFFTISVPATLLTYWAAKDTPAQAVFNYVTQILVSLLSVSMIRMGTEALGLSIYGNILVSGVFYVVVIYFEWRFLRRPFRMLIQVIPARWGVLTAIPCVICGYLIFVSSWPGSYLENDAQRAYVYAAVIPLIVVYAAIFKSLLSQHRIQMEQQDAALLKVQIAALQEKMQKTRELEEEIRIQRHDLRHQVQAVTELVARGDTTAALEFLDTAKTRLDEQKEIRWCRLPVLDAVFSSYFGQAQNQRIRVEAKISLPDSLPVDESELAIVLSNALENAIHANLSLSPERREIRCKMVGSPSVMLELSNPCEGPVEFDSQGLPISQREGHGLGVRSIAAFCERNGAVCRFDRVDGWFRLRLVL